MENAQHSLGLGPDKSCSSCGDTGSQHLMTTCIQCGFVSRHVYCMEFSRGVVPEEVPISWTCEDCCSTSGEANLQTTDEPAVQRKLHMNPVVHPSLKRKKEPADHHQLHMKPIKRNPHYPEPNSQVKCISLQEVAMLEAANSRSASKNTLGSKPFQPSGPTKQSVSRIKHQPSYINFGPTKQSVSRIKHQPSYIPFGPERPSRLGRNAGHPSRTPEELNPANEHTHTLKTTMKDKNCSGVHRSSEFDRVSLERNDTIDMEIDMMGVKPVGGTETVVSRESRASSAFENVERQQLPPESEQAIRNLRTFFSDFSERITIDLATMQRLVEKVCAHTTPVNVPPGFEDLRKVPVPRTEGDISQGSEDLPNNTCVSTTEVDIPPTGLFKINVAGRLKGNTEAGAGGTILDESGKWLEGFTMNLGKCTSVGAELWAVYWGLSLACDRKYMKVVVESDSRLAVEYVTGSTIAPPTYTTIVEACIKLLRLDWDCRILHVDRNANLSASWLAEQFGPDLFEMEYFSEPPNNLVSQL